MFVSRGLHLHVCMSGKTTKQQQKIISFGKGNRTKHFICYIKLFATGIIVCASVKMSKAVKSVAVMPCVLSYIHCNTFDRCKGHFADCDRVLQQVSISAPWKCVIVWLSNINNPGPAALQLEPYCIVVQRFVLAEHFNNHYLWFYNSRSVILHTRLHVMISKLD